MNTTIDLGGPGWAAREALGDTWRWCVDKLVSTRNDVGAATASRTPTA